MKSLLFITGTILGVFVGQIPLVDDLVSLNSEELNIPYFSKGIDLEAEGYEITASDVKSYEGETPDKTFVDTMPFPNTVIKVEVGSNEIMDVMMFDENGMARTGIGAKIVVIVDSATKDIIDVKLIGGTKD